MKTEREPRQAIAGVALEADVRIASSDGEHGSAGTLPKGWAKAAMGEVVQIWDNLREPVNAKERAMREGPFPYYGANGQAGTINDYRFDGDYLASQRQRKLDHLRTSTPASLKRLRPKRFNRSDDPMGEVQEDPARTRHRRSKASLHRHSTLRNQPGTRARRYPQYRRIW